ncbi:Acyl-CoA dehydrogenase [Rubrobacter radiotolerans]|uniref:Acyl-CoA dehydrogenase n=1 Tax=Rubrobacter radiotolerans TaxID=42256 RepID=A0A023X4E6_RUBRA|nr:acyl-CoA dehydrogenase family protein [Rubrobacter radiotolerans]AHY47347.1 Acyl-CoA dehydrogenase [Rubrobacter radiotolerans]MDX5894751.1 acyl-CoA dehydrogenase family protein [Rubrobacter radiotolerans]SMC06683.1 Acyl-CoA dehydrogenase [Rubrobacter radiotolerans DSM 5868]
MSTQRTADRTGRSENAAGTGEISPEDVAARIAAGAAARDAEPGFPEEPFARLAGAGLLSLPAPDSAGRRRGSFAQEWAVLRAVARADGSVGRILDGHYNAVERLSMLAPEPLRSEELARLLQGELLLGVWGADPIPGEGEPARLTRSADGYVLRGVKTFCSGAGGLDRALVAVRGESGEGPPVHLAYVDLTAGGVNLDRGWYRSAGMRSSESHRVVFDGAPVLAVLGEPGELVRQPYFSRDAIRTAVTWAGICDLALDSALEVLAAKSPPDGPDGIVSLAAGRMIAHRQTVDRWTQAAADLADNESDALTGAFAVSLRESVAAACRAVLDEAARACGSHPFATGSPLDRARRDLEVMLLQHRLEPALARVGREEILARRQDGGGA